MQRLDIKLLDLILQRKVLYLLKEKLVLIIHRQQELPPFTLITENYEAFVSASLLQNTRNQ
jgi:hypothetical protein